MRAALKRWRIRRVARRELPNTTGVENAHVVGEALVKLFARGYTASRIAAMYEPQFRAEALEMMRVAAVVYCPEQVEDVERLIAAQVPDDISSLGN